MHDRDNTRHDAHPTHLLAFTAAFVAAMGFGIILLAGGDWIPGGIIVAAALVGLASQMPDLWQLQRERSEPSPPKGRPAQ